MTTIDYLQIEGLVSRECQPYTGKDRQCHYRCDNPVEEWRKYYCEIGSLKVLTTHDEIKADLRKNGPLMMGLRIYEDFLNYESGIYKQVSGEMVGGHAMKLIGYGEDETEGLYWIL